MRLGTLVVAPGVKRAVSIDVSDYIDPDTVSGSPTWAGATGLTVSGPTFALNVATAYAIPSQEGCDYNLVCSILLSTGATEHFLVVIQCRTGEADPRLTR